MTIDVHDEWDAATQAEPRPFRVLLYSDEKPVRESVRVSVGRRVARDLPPVEWTEVATADAVVAEVEAGEFDLLVLDGEARKNGGMALARQLKDEIYRCPPVLLLTGRPADAWLARWSGAEAVVTRPLDPVVVHEAVAGLLRDRARA